MMRGRDNRVRENSIIAIDEKRKKKKKEDILYEYLRNNDVKALQHLNTIWIYFFYHNIKIITKKIRIIGQEDKNRRKLERYLQALSINIDDAYDYFQDILMHIIKIYDEKKVDYILYISRNKDRHNDCNISAISYHSNMFERNLKGNTLGYDNYINNAIDEFYMRQKSINSKNIENEMLYKSLEIVRICVSNIFKILGDLYRYKCYFFGENYKKNKIISCTNYYKSLNYYKYDGHLFNQLALLYINGNPITCLFFYFLSLISYKPASCRDSVIIFLETILNEKNKLGDNQSYDKKGNDIHMEGSSIDRNNPKRASLDRHIVLLPHNNGSASRFQRCLNNGSASRFQRCLNNGSASRFQRCLNNGSASRFQRCLNNGSASRFQRCLKNGHVSTNRGSHVNCRNSSIKRGTTPQQVYFIKNKENKLVPIRRCPNRETDLYRRDKMIEREKVSASVERCRSGEVCRHGEMCRHGETRKHGETRRLGERCKRGEQTQQELPERELRETLANFHISYFKIKKYNYFHLEHGINHTYNSEDSNEEEIVLLKKPLFVKDYSMSINGHVINEKDHSHDKLNCYNVLYDKSTISNSRNVGLAHDHTGPIESDDHLYLPCHDNTFHGHCRENLGTTDYIAATKDIHEEGLMDRVEEMEDKVRVARFRSLIESLKGESDNEGSFFKSLCKKYLLSKSSEKIEAFEEGAEAFEEGAEELEEGAEELEEGVEELEEGVEAFEEGAEEGVAKGTKRASDHPEGHDKGLRQDLPSVSALDDPNEEDSRPQGSTGDSTGASNGGRYAEEQFQKREAILESEMDISMHKKTPCGSNGTSHFSSICGETSGVSTGYMPAHFFHNGYAFSYEGEKIGGRNSRIGKVQGKTRLKSLGRFEPRLVEGHSVERNEDKNTPQYDVDNISHMKNGVSKHFGSFDGFVKESIEISSPVDTFTHEMVTKERNNITVEDSMDHSEQGDSDIFLRNVMDHMGRERYSNSFHEGEIYTDQKVGENSLFCNIPEEHVYNRRRNSMHDDDYVRQHDEEGKMCLNDVSKRMIIVDGKNIGTRYQNNYRKYFDIFRIKVVLEYYICKECDVQIVIPEEYIMQGRCNKFNDGYQRDKILEESYCNQGGNENVEFHLTRKDFLLLQHMNVLGCLIIQPLEDYYEYCLSLIQKSNACFVTNIALSELNMRLHKYEKILSVFAAHFISYTFLGDEFLPNPNFKWPIAGYNPVKEHTTKE
ncbi:conserved Plasmodium protein, unknown function [Plasmodium ovale wallikeri]|uniref:RNase NYN domain-containing protein n=1 Tax=Plasmodium ovale wallikeri TaxID=864142 RepID=A0A1A8YR46_PLAOA|nr:conserved Plasmodium protein, unknown function [Plasmodium ovale wallikeri]